MDKAQSLQVKAGSGALQSMFGSDLVTELGITFVLQAIKASFKNEESKAKFKKAMLKIRNQINLLYAGDADFE